MGLELNRHRLYRSAIFLMAASGLIAATVGWFGDWHWYADLFNHLRPQYCVWLGLALAGSWILKHRIAMTVAALGLLVNGSALAPYAWPWKEAPGSHAPGHTWTIATVNLLYGNQDVESVINYVRATQADIIVFEEISKRWAKDLEVLNDVYPHRLVLPRKDSFGIAVFSRQKPVELESRVMADRPADVAVVGVWENEGRRFAVAGVHPDKPDKDFKARRRVLYFEKLAQWCEEKAQAGLPVVAIGDFNATPWSSSLQSFVRQTGLRNANQGTIFGITWNYWQPHRLLIDHAFLSSHWSLLKREIGPAIGSDHRPLLVQVALRSETK